MINGITITRKKIFADERGRVMHIMKETDEDFIKFGEVYCSSIYPNIIKGWNLHKKNISNYSVIKGEIKLVIYDDRLASKTYKNFQEITLGESNYKTVSIPPLVWVAFKCISQNEAFLINVMDSPHDPNEVRKMKIENHSFNYKW